MDYTVDFNPIPPHLRHLLSYGKGARGCRWLCVPGDAVREVVKVIAPGMETKQISRTMSISEKAVYTMLRQDWVSEEKLDRLLTAFHCNHLWLVPPLNEIRQALLEYEAGRAGQLSLADAA